jgi:zinc transporter 5/7
MSHRSPTTTVSLDAPLLPGFSIHSKSKSPSPLVHITRFIRTIISDPKTTKIFYFLLLNLSFTLVEACYGVWTNSLGLTSDAVHMLFDSTAIIFSLTASVVAKWPKTGSFTYGYSRVETLTGFINGIALFFAGIGIIWESIERFYTPPEIVKDKLLTVAVLGFIVNMGMIGF